MARRSLSLTPARWALGLAAVWLVGGALRLPPLIAGDGGEYLLMAESLFRHGSPELRPGDVRALSDLEVKFHASSNFVEIDRGYFDAPSGGRFCYHFWGYSLLTLPAKALLHVVRANELQAPSLTNALFLLLALAACLGAEGPTARAWALFLASLFSPVLFLLRWPHTEVMSFALVSVSLLAEEKGHTGRAVLAAALAAMQTPPLALLVLLFASRAVLPPAPERSRRMLVAALAALPAVLPPIFFEWTFGTPSLLGRESTRLGLLSFGKALELFGDPNIGMLPYLPLTLVLFVWSLLRALSERQRGVELRNAALLLLLALASTVTGNWNHGMSGPSRYAIWIMPLVFQCAFAPRLFQVDRGFPRWLVPLALAAQAAACLLHGGLRSEPDYLEHSWAARQVLRWAPRLYHPSPEIFVRRTLHSPDAPTAAVVYRENGRCLKAYARPLDRDALSSLCGTLPPGPLGGKAGDGWRYVDFEVRGEGQSLLGPFIDGGGEGVGLLHEEAVDPEAQVAGIAAEPQEPRDERLGHREPEIRPSLGPEVQGTEADPLEEEARALHAERCPPSADREGEARRLGKHVVRLGREEHDHVLTAVPEGRVGLPSHPATGGERVPRRRLRGIPPTAIDEALAPGPREDPESSPEILPAAAAHAAQREAPGR
jgi:hypothetical protein